MTAKGYFQFPLCALSFGSEEERLNHIIAYSVVTAGGAMVRKLDSEIVSERADRFVKTPQDYSADDEHHVAAMIGAGEIGISFGGSIRRPIADYSRLSEFLERQQLKYGKDALVRIRNDFLFDARDKKGMTYREFAILCAVFSCIGSRKLVRITRATIRTRMLGYKSHQMMMAEFGNRSDGAQVLTNKQINYSLDRLDERKLFHRERPNRRQTYYSHRLDNAELCQALIQRKTKSSGFHVERRKRSAELMQKIKDQKAKMVPPIEVSTPIEVSNESPKPSQIPAPKIAHCVLTDGSLSAHFNRNSLIETSFNRISLNTVSLAPKTPLSDCIFPSKDQAIQFFKDEGFGRHRATSLARRLLRDLAATDWKGDWRIKARETLPTAENPEP